MVCGGTGSVSEVNGLVSSCFAATAADEEEDELTDDELDVDEDEVVRFFLPVLVDEGGGGFELMYSVTCWRYSWLIFNCC